MTTPVAFITGASSGIGRALALEVAKRGYRLALAARRQDLLVELAAEIGAENSAVKTFACDVADQTQVKRAISATVQEFGSIDLAILSAGVGGPTDPVHFYAKDIERLVTTNLFGVAYCLEELIPLMTSRSAGTIAVLSSIAADRGIPDSAGYCASKAALSTLCEGLRGTLRKQGIRLVTIEPGYVRTPMTTRFKRMPFLMEADDAARLILRRIERGDRVIRFPLIPSIFMKVVRILPDSLFDVLTAMKT